MNKEEIIQKFDLGGKEVTLKTGRLAHEADAAVMVECGGTSVLVTVVASEPREGMDYFPLFIEYVERLYAGGVIKGSRWVKREGKPSDEAILNARLIDRSVRPLFPKDFMKETQIVATVLSVDHENDADMLSAIGASAALHVSQHPWNGPLGIVRVGFRDGNYFVNPTASEREESDLDLIVTTGEDGVVMLEGGAEELSEQDFYGAVEFGKDQGEKVMAAIEEFRKKAGKEKVALKKETDEVEKEIKQEASKKVSDLVDQLYKQGEGALEIIENYAEQLTNDFEGVSGNKIKDIVDKLFKKEFRKRMLKGKRLDNRKLDEVRELNIDVDVLPRTHGSAVFERGKTQALTVATLGGLSLKQWMETPEGEETKRYIHHYFFPPYSVGETGRFGYPGRREIGHGALAERALKPVIPSEDDFPYTIRLVSEIMASNGSTSMASTCGSTLALMDAGVPIKRPVAGIAVGLVQEGDDYVLLTDMQGAEDFNGDMDFKVTGTKQGITAIQVDIKSTGLSMEVVEKALERARKARELILDQMEAVIKEPRGKVSEYAPKIVIKQIPVKKIGDLIGPGGKTIKKIIEETGCTVDVDDDGTVTVVGKDKDAVAQAVDKVDAITREVHPGEVFKGEVTRVEPFGAFVEFLPGRKGLVHVSKMGKRYIKDAQDVLDVGQEVKVKLEEIDDRGRYNLILVEPRFDDDDQSSGSNHQSSNNKVGFE
jgi:polyribonucleotide nucleotidyltransferase